jgi:hypothetical protein
MKNLLKKKDILIIVGILVVALVFLLVVELTKEDGASVLVRINGEEVATYSLTIDAQYELNSGTNILCIKNNEAYLVDANCPDHLCVKQGKISKNGETITCLPNKLTITVIGAQDSSVELVS